MSDWGSGREVDPCGDCGHGFGRHDCMKEAPQPCRVVGCKCEKWIQLLPPPTRAEWNRAASRIAIALTSPDKKGHPRFHELLAEMAKTHVAKGSDYSNPDDILSNLRTCEQIGVPAWKGALVRLLDKVERIKNLARKEDASENPAVSDESFEDSLMDLGSYSLLVRILREQRKRPKADPVCCVEMKPGNHHAGCPNMPLGKPTREEYKRTIQGGCPKCGQTWPECGHD